LRTGSVTISATATLDGTQVSVPNGSFTSSAGAGSLVTWAIGNENFRFDTLSLKAVKGGFSLEGNAATGSTFDLMGTAEEVLGCGDSISDEGDNLAAAFTQIDDRGEEVQTCGEIGASLTIAGRSATFLKPVGSAGRFIVDFNWSIDVPEFAEVPTTEVNFEIKDSAGAIISEDIQIPWCKAPEFTADEDFPGTGRLTGVDTVGVKDMVEDVDGSPATQGLQYACLGTQSATPDPAGQLQVKEQIYLEGDIRLQK